MNETLPVGQTLKRIHWYTENGSREYKIIKIPNTCLAYVKHLKSISKKFIEEKIRLDMLLSDLFEMIDNTEMDLPSLDILIRAPHLQMVDNRFMLSAKDEIKTTNREQKRMFTDARKILSARVKLVVNDIATKIMVEFPQSYEEFVATAKVKHILTKEPSPFYFDNKDGTMNMHCTVCGDETKLPNAWIRCPFDRNGMRSCSCTHPFMCIDCALRTLYQHYTEFGTMFSKCPICKGIYFLSDINHLKLIQVAVVKTLQQPQPEEKKT
jgi:hypothetical protein